MASTDWSTCSSGRRRTRPRTWRRIGFTPEEATLLKSGLGEVPGIETAVDATQFLKRFWGVVVVGDADGHPDPAQGRAAPVPGPIGPGPSSLAAIEQEIAARVGPFALLEVLTGDQGSLTVEVLKSTLDLGGWEDLSLLRREATQPADRVARVRAYDPALGQLQPDRRYVTAPCRLSPWSCTTCPPISCAGGCGPACGAASASSGWRWTGRTATTRSRRTCPRPGPST